MFWRIKTGHETKVKINFTPLSLKLKIQLKTYEELLTTLFEIW